MDIQKLIDEYASWLKSEITFDRIGEFYEITTPYLDNANDYLQIYVKQDGNEIIFTDDGATLQKLKMAGVRLNSVRKEHLQRILFQYGVALTGEELTSKSTSKNFPQKKHLFVQAMLRVEDIFAAAKGRTSSFFLDDVQDFFNEREIYFSDNVQFTGISGFSHSYDFLIQRSRTKPERLCQTVNTPNKSNMGNIIFSWNDTRPARRKGSQLIVILNDKNAISRGVEEAFLNYDAEVIRWSEIGSEQSISLLSA